MKTVMRETIISVNPKKEQIIQTRKQKIVKKEEKFIPKKTTLKKTVPKTRPVISKTKKSKKSNLKMETTLVKTFQTTILIDQKSDHLKRKRMKMKRVKKKEATREKQRMMRAGLNFINILCTNFWYERCFFYVHVTRENNVRTKNSYV